MKRLYNSIPLGSVLYLISGLQEIKVVDYDNSLYKTNGKVVFEGKYNDGRHILMFRKYELATLHGIYNDNGVIRFEISTKYEEY